MIPVLLSGNSRPIALYRFGVRLKVVTEQRKIVETVLTPLKLLRRFFVLLLS